MEMRAVVQTGFGSAAQVLGVERVPRPTAGPGELLVRVHAAGVAMGNALITHGLPWIARPMYGMRRPKQAIAGLQFAGVVEAVGAGVTEFQTGDDVFGSHSGAFAEWIAVPATAIAAKPGSVSYEQAAAVPISGIAALQAVRDAARVERDQRVLVIGASGGVGAFAVQIARSLGAEVTGVAGPRSLDRVRALGASRVIDYSREAIDAGGKDYDAIIDIAGNRSVAELRAALGSEGVLVIVGGTGGRLTMGFGRTVRAMLLDRFVSQRLIGLLSTSNAADLAELARLMAEGQLNVEIESALPLESAADAVDRVWRGQRGGAVVLIP